ncbi:protein kinase [Candidatus Woesearchaeota archaeon]|nr:protein kinase [Candidatus Woesearchaeota archaeon]
MGETNLESMLTQIKPGAQIYHYSFIDKLGEGGMGVVWKAMDERLNREIAIKFLPEKYNNDLGWLNRFAQEARTVAKLKHPNIVTIYSIGKLEGLNCITMEYIKGKTLKELMPKRGMAIKTFFNASIPIVQAVGAAHNKNIIHGDLKPANIMITDEEGIVKVLDFGLASRYQEKEFDPDQDKTMTFVGEKGLTGTYHYMSPENIVGKPKVLQSDVFSLGIIFYEMLTGKKPFKGRTPSEVIASVLKDTPRMPSEINMNVSARLDRLVSKCLSKEPEKRFGSATELLEELSNAMKQPYSPSDRKSLSIAVLPFMDISPAKDQEYFCDGLAEELINALSHVKDIRVKSRTSSFKFKGKEMDSQEIGDNLEVNAVIEGSIFKYENRVRVTVKLINVADGFQLWSKKYDKELKDIFQIQNEISEGVVKTFELSLTPSERRFMRQVSTENIDAYEHYLRGREYFRLTNKKGMEFAIQLFSRAIEIDRNYALAHAGMADSLAFLYLHSQRNPDYIAQADAVSKKALKLDPDLMEVHISRGTVLSLMDKAEEAEKEFDAAVKLAPNSFEAHYTYARELFSQGKKDMAIKHYERAYELRPEDYQPPTLVAQSYDDLGMKEKGADARRRGVKAVEKHLELHPDDTRALYMGANSLVCLGEKEKALEWARRAYELEPKDSMLLYNLACIYSLAEETDLAIISLQRAVSCGFAHVEWLKQDSNLDSVREKAEFKELVDIIINK